MLTVKFLLGCILALASAQSNTNIYGYNYDSAASNNGISLVQNPNYQFLNDQLASAYAQTYQQNLRQYDQSGGQNGVVTSSTNVPANGYYTGPPLSNDQQNQINYQQIQQRNPTSSVSSNTNIYGYQYSSPSSNGATNLNYNNQPQYSAPSNNANVQPYIYPFGQYSTSQANRFSSYRDNQYNQNPTQVYYNDQGASTQYYTLFDQPASGPVYQSASDLKTTTLRDQQMPGATIRLRGTGPLPGPTLAELSGAAPTGNQQQVYYDSRSSYRSYPKSQGNSNARFFDVAGNDTVMYYPYRTSTNYNLPSSSSNSQVFYNPSGSNSNPYGQTTIDKCSLNDPYWCSEYVNLYMNAKRTYENVSTQQACITLIQSLTESYNGCCTAVRSAGCTMN
ncbi:unnamed protein product [Caenorhabditis bovis]|uniref:Uncharacterized protein n=1 Tax=Caenorhabditis bovis TaxID=2654633 RepID=A0A8S1FCT4_9PELO|nr:unnamed protein product [Caenorhabditis bovis]